MDSGLRMQLASALRRLAPLQISPTSGRLQEWIEDYKEVDPGHRHISHLFARPPGAADHPGDAGAGGGRAQEPGVPAVQQGRQTGWSRAWIANMWARFGDGDRAYESLKALLVENTSDALLDLHPPGIFQMDGNGGATAAIAEMLLQSHAGEIHLLPALPRAWPGGSVTGLRARGGFQVDLRWQKGTLAGARLKAAENGPCRVRTSLPVEVSSGGQSVTVRRPEPAVITFQAQRGTTYELQVPPTSSR